MNTTTIKIRRTVNGGPPDDLEPGELSAEMTIPPKLWLGVSAAVHADERLLLVGDPALPAGGAQYDVLSKASATDGDVAWARMVRIGGDTMTGPLAINRNTAPLSTIGTPNRHTLRIQGMDNQHPYFVMDAFNSFPMLNLRRANGSAVSPTEVVDTNEVGRINFTTAIGDPTLAGGIVCYAMGDWSSTARPCRIDILTPLDIGVVSQLQASFGPKGVRVPPSTLDSLTDPSGGMQRGDLNAHRLFVQGVPVVVTPSGGAQYDVLTKSSATATDPPTWAGAGVRPNNNTVIGSGAYNLTATGSQNVAIGAGALAAATNASMTVAIGREAAMSATSAGSSIVLGFRALRDGGSFCIALGHQALQGNTANNNIGIGYQALLVNNTGADNVGIGHEVMWQNTSGQSNVAMGYQALYNNNTGSMNVAIGRGALFNVTGATAQYNVAIGGQAGRYSRLGGGNNTSATASIYIGFEGRALNPGETNAIVIGSATAPNVDFATSKGSNTIVLGNDSTIALYTRAGLVLGSNMGAVYTDVSGAKGPGTVNATGYFLNGTPLADTLDLLPTGGAIYDVLSKSSATDRDVEWRGAGVRPNNNTVIGAGSLPPTTTGDFNVAIGVSVLAANTTGRLNVAIGRFAMTANTTGDQTVAVGHHAMQRTTTGRANTGVGRAVLENNVDGNSNAAFGDGALSSLVGGFGNIGIGAGAGTGIGISPSGLTLANNSIHIGYSTRTIANDPNNEIVIGSSIGTNYAVGHGSNTITLGNANVTALYTHAGLVLGNAPTGGAKGQGSVNATSYWLDGEPFEPVTGPLRFVGSYDPNDGEITASSGSPAISGPLPAADPDNEGWVLIVSDEGEGQAPAPVVDMHPGDWLISDGSEWIFHEMHLPALIAENVMLTAISGLTADNVQDAIEALHTAIDEFEALPNGGDEYEVLTKQSATDFDVGWSPVGVRPNASIGIGTDVLAAVTTGTDNIAIGNNALALINTGSTAVAVGNNALGAATFSLRVTAVGHNAMANGSGFDNTAVGFNAGATITGSGSVAIGSNALGDTTGTGNIAIGSSAARYLTTSGNIAIGGSALAGSSTTGSAGTNNIAIGGSALSANTASNSIAIGAMAVRTNNTGNNIGVGHQVMQFISGGDNVAVGYLAMSQLNTASNQNVAIGSEAARHHGIRRNYVTEAQDSIFIGYDASPQDATGNINQIVIGHRAHGNGSHTATIGSYWTTALYAPATLALRNNSTMLQVSGSQAPIPNNEIIASIEWQGLHGVPTYNTYHRTGAVIRARTLQTWASAAAGARLEFLATPNGTTTPEPRMMLSQGLTVGDLTVVDRGPGTVNASGGYFLNGEPLVVTNRSVSWLAGSNPEGAILAYADRDMQIIGNLLFICETDNGEPANVRVVKAAANTSLLGGTPVHTGNFNANTPPGTYINITPTIRNLDAGERLGLLTGGNFQISAASITVRLA